MSFSVRNMKGKDSIFSLSFLLFLTRGSLPPIELGSLVKPTFFTA